MPSLDFVDVGKHVKVLAVIIDHVLCLEEGVQKRLSVHAVNVLKQLLYLGHLRLLGLVEQLQPSLLRLVLGLAGQLTLLPLDEVRVMLDDDVLVLGVAQESVDVELVLTQHPFEHQSKERVLVVHLVLVEVLLLSLEPPVLALDLVEDLEHK
eukprot:CAMPEP_0168613824 /NCGR_PEP_ID=MMETSP0449_2-20121227/3652_1 /TAXON_ID=1082188 /ORGANISM="Strombidium rassoulzadegani, Strain ras09" /LENGTH=151 /DNA_ID=CAMNT_0008654473 /DNA_START=399 /DNA_END=854 /DNA_ORIENTATION=+